MIFEANLGKKHAKKRVKWKAENMEKGGSQQKSQMDATKIKNREAKQEERWLQIREENRLEKWQKGSWESAQKG